MGCFEQGVIWAAVDRVFAVQLYVPFACQLASWPANFDRQIAQFQDHFHVAEAAAEIHTDEEMQIHRSGYRFGAHTAEEQLNFAADNSLHAL